MPRTFTVAKKHQTNDLSHTPGGYDVIIFSENGNLTYTNIKNPYAYYLKTNQIEMANSLNIMILQQCQQKK